MPSKSKKQAKLMAAVAHNAQFARKVGVPQSVGREFNAADEAVGKYAGGGKVKSIQELKAALDNWEKNKLPQKGFFSTLDEHIANAPQQSMPAFQWQNYLKAGRMLDRGGIQFPLKQEELNYGQVPKLAEKFGADTNLTQDQVRDYVRENRPDLNLNINTRDQGVIVGFDPDVRSARYGNPHYDTDQLRFRPSVPKSYQESITTSPDIGNFSSHFSPQDISWSRTTRHQLPGDQTARLIEEIQSDRHSAAAEKGLSFKPDPSARQRMLELYKTIIPGRPQEYYEHQLGEVDFANYRGGFPGYYPESVVDAAQEFTDLQNKSKTPISRIGYRTPEQEQAIIDLTAAQDQARKSQPALRAQYRHDHENQLLTPEGRVNRLIDIQDLEHRIGENSSKLQTLKAIPPDAPFKDPRDYATHEVRKQLLNSVDQNDRFLALTRGQDQIKRYEQGMGADQEQRGMREMYDNIYPSVLAKEAGRYGATSIQDLNVPKIKTKSNIRPQAFVDVGVEHPEDFLANMVSYPQRGPSLLAGLFDEYKRAGVSSDKIKKVQDVTSSYLKFFGADGVTMASPGADKMVEDAQKSIIGLHNAWKRKVEQANPLQDLNIPVKAKSNIRPKTLVDTESETLADFLDEIAKHPPGDQGEAFRALLKDYKEAGVPAARVDKVEQMIEPYVKNMIANPAYRSGVTEDDPIGRHPMQPIGEALAPLHVSFGKINTAKTFKGKSFPAAELTPEVAQRIRDIGVPIFSLGAGAVAAPYYLQPNSDDQDPQQGYAEGGKVHKTLDYWRAIADSLANAVPFTTDPKTGDQNKLGHGISDALSRVSSGLASQVLTREPDAPGIEDSGGMSLGMHPGILDELAAFPELMYSMQDTYSGADPTSLEPGFVKKGVENTDKNYDAARRGLNLSEPHGFVDHALEALGVMAGQVPLPGSAARRLATLTRSGSKGLNAASKVLGAGAEWLSPTISPHVSNYAKGALFGGTSGAIAEAIAKKPDPWAAKAMQEVLDEGNMQTPYYVQANSDSDPRQGYAGGGKVKSIQELKAALDNWEKNKLPQKGFFSTLDEHIANAPQQSMPAFQWQNYLKAGRMLDRGGIQFPLKQEELNYGQVPKLAEKFGADTNLTQDQVRDYVRENRPDLNLQINQSNSDPSGPGMVSHEPRYDASGFRFRPSVPKSYQESITTSPDIGNFSSHFSPQDISWSRTTRHQLPGDQTARLIEEIQSDRHSAAAEKVELPGFHAARKILYDARDSGQMSPSEYSKAYDELLKKHSGSQRTGYRTPEQDQELKDLTTRLAQISERRRKDIRLDLPPAFSPEERALDDRHGELIRIPPDAPFKDPRDYATHEVRKQLLNSVADNDRFLALTRGQDQIARFEQGTQDQESRGMREMYDKVYPSVLAREAGRYGATGIQDLNIPKIKTKSNIRPQAFVDAEIDTPRNFLYNMGFGANSNKVLNTVFDEYKKGGIDQKRIEDVRDKATSYLNFFKSGQLYPDFDSPNKKMLDEAERSFINLHNAWKRKVKQADPQASTKTFPAAELTPEVAQRIRDIGVPIFSLGAGAVAAPYYLQPNSEDQGQEDPQQGYAAGGPVDPRLPQLIPGGTTSPQYYPLNLPETLTLPPPGTPGAPAPVASTRDSKYTPLSPDWYAHYGEGPEYLFLGNQAVNLPKPTAGSGSGTAIPQGAIPSSGGSSGGLLTGLTLAGLAGYDAYQGYQTFSGAPSNTVIPAGPGTPASTGDDNEDASGTPDDQSATDAAPASPSLTDYAGGALGAGLGALQLYSGIKAGGLGGISTALRGAGQVANAANSTGLYQNTFGNKLGAAGQTLAGIQTGGVKGYTQAAVGASNLANSLGYGNALTSAVGSAAPYVGAALALTGKGTSSQKAVGALSAAFPVLAIPQVLQSLGAFGKTDMGPEKQQAIHNYAVAQGAVLVPKDPTHPGSIDYSDPNSYTLDYTQHYETPAETAARIKTDSGGNADLAKLLQQEGDYYIGDGATSSNHIAGTPSAITAINQGFTAALADPTKLAELRKTPFFADTGKTTEQITAEHGGVPWNAYGPISSLYWTPAQKAFMASKGITQ